MSNRKRLIVGVCLVLAVFIGIAAPRVLAQEPMPFDSPLPGSEYPPLPPVDVGGMEDYVASVGIGAVVMMIIEILKKLGAVPDGQAGRWATVANIVIFAGLVVAGIFGVNYAGDDARMLYDLLNRIGQAALLVVSSPLLFEAMRLAQVFRKPDPARPL